MKKKGFTLVELIAVLAVLGILLMMAVPNLVGLFDNKKEELYNQTITELERLTGQYLIENPNLYTEIDEYGYVDIYTSQLCSDKYITCPISDPRDNSELNGYIRITGVDGDYTYTFNSSGEKIYAQLNVDLNGGNISENYNSTYEVGTKITLKEPTRTGYVFTGWEVISGNSKLNGNMIVIGSDNTEIRAKWIKNKGIILTLNPNGGTTSTNNINVTNNGTYSNLPTPTRVGYTFLGWYIGEVKINNGDKVTISVDSTANARWKANTYIVKLDPNGGSVNSTQVSIDYDSPYGELPTPTKLGYTFDGWYIGNNKITLDSIMNIVDGTTLKSKWAANTYVINYDLDGGTHGTSHPTSGIFDKVIEIDNPSKTGYDFTGWTVTNGLNTSTAKYGSNSTTVVSSIDSSSTKILAKYFKNLTDKGSVTLRANYAANTFLLRLNGNGVNVNPSEIIVEKAGTYIGLPTLTRTGYTFLGWYIGNLEINNGDTVTLTNNAEATAKWQVNTYIISFDTDGGSLLNPVNISYGSKYDSLPKPEREGYTFLGWYTESNQPITSNSIHDILGNVTLYAKWLESEFAYENSERTIVVPKDGYYKLEVWGAQGGSYSSDYPGGYGGYSTGVVYLNDGNTLYINVGGKGNGGYSTAYSGGYNGGGKTTASVGSSSFNSSGGGATHIAISSGLLSSFKTYETACNENSKHCPILIVAGGGGGTHNHPNGKSSGGPGGGINGSSPYNIYLGSSKCTSPTGGTQLQGGIAKNSSSNYGSFGAGGNYGGQYGAGGGGGFYGGGSGGNADSCAYSAAGGSGYIGNSLLTNKVMYCYNCNESKGYSTKTISTENISEKAISNYVKTGDGYARITYVGENIELEAFDTNSSEEFYFENKEQKFVIPLSGYYKLETWGAQGGSYSSEYQGGYGGYSTGEVYLDKDEILYINVGGKGNGGYNTAYSGGYNGGGSTTASSGSGNYNSSGGGATHIATLSGVLSSLNAYETVCKENSGSCPILIAAGGGGGTHNHSNGKSSGGPGGGMNGASPYNITMGSTNCTNPTGGTQTSGGTANNASSNYGSFGLGGNYSGTYGAGGGGGFFGGGSGGDGNSCAYSAAGGSGYIGNSLLTNKVMYCYNCDESENSSSKTISTVNISEKALSNYAKTGDGFVRITYIRP